MYGEFVERTGVYVSIDEFNTIVEVYNNSDVNKDEFCKLWAKMNFARVKAAKLNKDFMVNFNMLAIHVIGSASYKKLVDAMHVCGIIEIDEYCPLGHYVNTLDNSINEYWEKTAEKHI